MESLLYIILSIGVILLLSLFIGSINLPSKNYNYYFSNILVNNLFQKAYSSFVSKKYNEAIKYYTKSIELRPDYAEAYYNRGLVYQHCKDQIDKAINDYSKALSLKPDYIEALNNRGIAYAKKEKYDKALKDYTKAIKIMIKKNPNIYFNRALIFTQMNLFEMAINDYTKAIELNPNFIAAYRNRSFLYKLIGDYVKSESDLEKIKELEQKYKFKF